MSTPRSGVAAALCAVSLAFWGLVGCEARRRPDGPESGAAAEADADAAAAEKGAPRAAPKPGKAAAVPETRAERDGKALARQILAATGVGGGLVVHVGCGDGKLTAALAGPVPSPGSARSSYLRPRGARPRGAAGGSYVVHGLDEDPGNVAEARKHIRSLGVYGRVSAEQWRSAYLPYANNLVNMVVAEELGRIPMAEAVRVLCPGGVAYVKRGDTWSRTVKGRPEDTDEWTHYSHDASGNAVARDRVVGPPRCVQWIAGPRHSRSHEHTPSVKALVSTGGRIFYIVDEAPTVSIRRPSEWHLVARDAYNGILLWKRPIAAWFPRVCGWTQGPRQLQRKLVAVGNRVYVALGFHAPLSAVDAATGETIKAYERTRGTEEVILHKGRLLLVVRSVTDERIAELAKWERLSGQKGSPLYARETMEPLLKSFRAVEARAERTIRAIDADTGRVLWERAGWLRPLSLCAGGDRVFYQKGKDVLCLDLVTGRELWSTPSAGLRLACDGTVVCADGRTVTALSAASGKALWSRPASLCQVRDVFVINGSLWVGGFKPWQGRRTGKRGPPWGPYFVTQRDIATGKILKRIEPEGPGHHHRCYANKATDRYILGGRRGVEFIDLRSGEVLWHSWVRGVCRYGVMPSNGLLYAPPHACGCYIAAKLTGFNALAAERGPRPAASELDRARLERGPAYSEGARTGRPALRDQDWPTYRHDAQRSGCTRTAVGAALRRRWRTAVGGKLTSPIIAQGKVFVASVDEHGISALDADSGDPVWRFTAGGRVDSPPTLHRGRAIFGCRDGYVYCVRASDGALVWRLRAARDERYITARGQLESASPVHGSVLVRDGAAYFAAGRSSYLDGGIDLYRIRPETGEVLSATPIYSPDPETGRQPRQHGPCNMPGALADILTSDERHVYLRDMVFDKDGGRQPKGNPHLLTLTGFLDDSWPHRSYWIFGTRCSLSTGCSRRDRNLVFGRLLVFDESTIYGYGRKNVHWSNQLQDGGYRLFALSRRNAAAPAARRGARGGAESAAKWTKPVTVRVRAMVLAGKVLFVAGAPLRGSAAEQPIGDGRARRGEDQEALLIAISASDGAELARYRLDSPPVFDGMAAAAGRLYLSTIDGRMLCLHPQPQGRGGGARRTVEVAGLGTTMTVAARPPANPSAVLRRSRRLRGGCMP